ncbi:hypothetical protein NSP_29930 [Nodularia spumigena CCY9414]|nr:hypothetical protein NSP_29930 [Nodularia spumigena CCY9414]
MERLYKGLGKNIQFLEMTVNNKYILFSYPIGVLETANLGWCVSLGHNTPDKLLDPN